MGTLATNGLIMHSILVHLSESVSLQIFQNDAINLTLSSSFNAIMIGFIILSLDIVYDILP